MLNLTVLNFLVLIVPCAHHSRAYRFRTHRSVLIVPRAYRSPILSRRSQVYGTFFAGFAKTPLLEYSSEIRLNFVE